MGTLILRMLPIKSKRIGQTIWFHKVQLEKLGSFPEILEEVNAVSQLYKDKSWNIVKLTNKREVTLIYCKDFDSDSEPVIDYWLKRNKIIFNSPKNLTIFHKRYLMVPNDYKGFDVEKDFKRCELIEDYITTNKISKTKIGKLNYWKDFLVQINKF